MSSSSTSSRTSGGVMMSFAMSHPSSRVAEVTTTIIIPTSDTTIVRSKVLITSVETRGCPVWVVADNTAASRESSGRGLHAQELAQVVHCE